MKKAVGLIFISLYLGMNCFGQQPEKIAVELTTAAVTSAVFPYDIPFYITGKPPDNAVKILFSYKVSDKEKHNGHFRHWITLPVRDPNGTFTQTGKWPLQNGEATYSLLCDGLHPGLKYDFRFEIFRNIVDDAALKADLKQKLAARIRVFTNLFSTVAYTQTNLDNLADDLTNIVKAKLIAGTDQELRVKATPGTLYTVNIRATLKDYISNAVTASAAVKNADDDLRSAGNQLGNAVDELRSQRNPILADIAAILSDGAKPTETTKSLLDLPVAPSVDAFKVYTLRNALLVLKKLCQPPDRIDGFIRRSQQIVNNDVVPMASASLADPQNIYFLQALIAFLKDGNVAADTGIKFQYLDNLDTYLTAVAGDYRAIADNTAALAALTASFPDLTTEIVLSESVNLETTTVPDVTTANTPYISAEGGLGLNTAFQAAFSYLGANIYSTPINKKAPLKTFRGLDRFRKMASLSIGISTLYADRPVHTSSFIGGTGKNDLFVGLGLRLNRVIKLNLSCMPYYLNPNPVTADKTLKFSVVCGIGFDVNLLGALGGVAHGLNLTP